MTEKLTPTDLQTIGGLILFLSPSPLERTAGFKIVDARQIAVACAIMERHRNMLARLEKLGPERLAEMRHAVKRHADVDPYAEMVRDLLHVIEGDST